MSVAVGPQAKEVIQKQSRKNGAIVSVGKEEGWGAPDGKGSNEEEEQA